MTNSTGLTRLFLPQQLLAAAAVIIILLFLPRRRSVIMGADRVKPMDTVMLRGANLVAPGAAAGPETLATVGGVNATVKEARARQVEVLVPETMPPADEVEVVLVTAVGHSVPAPEKLKIIPPVEE